MSRTLPLFVILVGTMGVPVLAQTQVDLKAQTKNVDFSTASLVRPFRMGSALPVTCMTGEMFFSASAVAGSNLYGCVATNTWAPEGATTAVMASAPFATTLLSGTSLSTASNCSMSSPCVVRIGSAVYSVSAPATITLNGGTGMAYIYIGTTGAIVVSPDNVGLNLSCSACSIGAVNAGFPLDSIPLAVWSATSGVWAGSGTDSRAALSTGKTLTAGPNVSITQTADTVVISANGGLAGNTAAAGQPVCNASLRGQSWFVQGVTLTKDALQVCAKDATEAYAWRTLY